MYERKFADAYDMNIKKIHNMILSYIGDKEEFDFCCKEDAERVKALNLYVKNFQGIDIDLKNEFIDNLSDTLYYATLNSFDNGLRIGLSLLKNLLTAEPPEIHVTHRRVPEKPNNEIIEEFSRVCENIPLREQVHLMTMIYEYEEQYHRNNTLTENEET